MDRFDAMRIFVSVAERASFTLAADNLGLSKAAISGGVRYLENMVGVRLFHRTTRSVQLTQDGTALFERCTVLLADLEELETSFQHEDKPLTGRLRVDMPATAARDFIIPRLPEFLAAHPGLQLELSSTDRRVDVIGEGFDGVLRIGNLRDSNLVARRLGHFKLLNCASPAYVKRFGMPKKLADLSKHQLIHYTLLLGAKPEGFEYCESGVCKTFNMPGVLTVNNATAYEAACLAGVGIIQVPALCALAHIKAGRMVELLPKFRAEPMPVNFVYANRKHLSKRVQVFMSWLIAVLAPHLSQENLPRTS